MNIDIQGLISAFAVLRDIGILGGVGVLAYHAGVFRGDIREIKIHLEKINGRLEKVEIKAGVLGERVARGEGEHPAHS